MSKIILDARSGDENSQSTKLALRTVRGYSEEINGTWTRPMRELHTNYELIGEILYISEADGNLLDRNKIRVKDSLEALEIDGKTYYFTGLDKAVDILRVNGQAFVADDFEVFYGGVKIRALDDRIINSIAVQYKGVTFNWTRNDDFRNRFEWKGGRWGLLSGGNISKKGVASSSEAEVRIGAVTEGQIRLGSDPSDVGSTTYVIGSSELPIVAEATLSEYDFSNEVGAIGNESGLIAWNDSISKGKDFFYVTETFEEDGFLTPFNSENGLYNHYISPIPYYHEYPMIRKGFEGFLDVVFFDNDTDLDSYVFQKENEVLLSLSSGKLVSAYNNLRYEGVVLGRKSEILQYAEISSGAELPVATSEISGVSYLPDGSSFTPTAPPTSVDPDGGGLVKDLEMLASSFVCVGGGSLLKIVKVEELPTNWMGSVDLRGDRAYFCQGKIYLSAGVISVAKNRREKETIFTPGYPLFSLVQAFAPLRSFRNNEYISQRKVKGSGGGTFTLENGDVVVYNDDGTVQGSDKVSVSSSGHLVVGSEILFPENDIDKQGLQNIFLSPFSEISGLSLCMTGKSISHYTDLNNEEVGEVQQLIFNFFDFTPREDFKGYGIGKFFRVGLKVLENNIDIIHRFSEKKLEWIENLTVVKKVKTPENTLFLSAGLKPNTTSIEIKNGGAVEVLVEGVDYDLPLNGQGGFARLKAELSNEIVRGYEAILSSGEFDLGEISLAGVSTGDFLYLNADKVYRRISSVNPLVVESLNVLNSAGVKTDSELSETDHGAWRIYKGYPDPDPTRLCQECFVSIPTLENGFLSVKKTYAIQNNVPLSSAHPSSNLFIKSDLDKTISLSVLVATEIDNNFIDTTSPHFLSGDYLIYVDDVLKTINVDYTVDNQTGEISFTQETASSSEVVFSPQPRVLSEIAEVLSDGTNLAVPVDFGTATFLAEEVDSPKFNSETGSISFSRPMRRGVGVEVSYFPLSSDGTVGDRISETIVFLQTNQPATRISATEYSYNPDNYNIYLDVEPVAYAGTLPVGYAGAPTPTFTQNKIIFPSPIPEESPVVVSFVTSSAVGGEYTVKTTSSIYEPALEISKGGNSVRLPYVNSDIEANQILSIGTHAFKVSSVSNDGVNTNISFTPSARYALRGNLKRTNRTDLFIQVVDTLISCEPRSSEFLIMGDLTKVLVEDSILEVEEIPYRVKLSTLLDNGVTKVEVHGYSNGHEATSYKYSIRPIYDEGSTTLKPLGGLIVEDGYVLIKEEAGFGISLTPNVDYILEDQTGQITLLNGHTIKRNLRYTLRHTAITTLAPMVLNDGRISFPKYKATFQASSVPDKYQGFKLFSTCKIETPDTFYLEVVDEETYVSEVSAKLLNQSADTSGGRRASFSISEGKAFGIYESLGKDIVARNRIKFYDGLISPVDDIVSTISGSVIGDQDGKFRFDLNSSGTWGGAGLEDPITREIQPRYLTLESLSLTPDPPLTPGKNLTEFQATAGLDILRKAQMKYLENEMDDIVLSGAIERLEFKFDLPFFEFKYYPIYEGMYRPSRVSRLFPEEAQFMTILAPSEIGRYTAGHEVPVDPSDDSLFAKTREVVTRGRAIGKTQNFAMGEIKNISGISTMKKRNARFRIWDYSPTGFPEIPDYPAQYLGKPALIVSALLFRDFPLTEFGYPDIDALTATGDNDPKYPNVERGNSYLKYKGLSVGDKIEIGRPKEGFSAVVNISETVTVEEFGEDEETITSPIFAEIEAIWGGCVVVLKGSASTLYYFGNSFIERPPERGDTLIESLRNNLDAKPSSSKTYNINDNIGLNAGNGELVDITYSSEKDIALLNPIEINGFPLKELLDQVTPNPLTPLEGLVTFPFPQATPFEYPALRGEEYNDSGDFTIPYVANQSERDILPQIGSEIRKLISTNVGGVYVFPDELRLVGNTLNGDIESSVSLTPFEDDNTLPSVDVRKGDLLVVDLEDNTSATGFLEVSAVEGNNIIVPRFVSPTEAGEILKYDITNFFYADYANTDIGISIQQQNLNPNYLTTISLSTNNSSITFDQLFSFILGCTSPPFLNRFRIKNLNNFPYYIEFQYDGVNFYVYTDEVVVGRIVIPTLTEIDDYNFSMVTAFPIFTKPQWSDLLSDFGAGAFTQYDTLNGNFNMQGDGGNGVDYGVDLLLSDGTYYTAGAVLNNSEGGSVTAVIREDRVSIQETEPNFSNSWLRIKPVSQPSSLYVYSNEMPFVDDQNNTVKIFSDLNSHVYLNDSQPFQIKSVSNTDVFSVHSLENEGVFVSFVDKKMSVWSGSEVYKNSTGEGNIFSGECSISSYDLAPSSASVVLNRMNVIESDGNLGQIKEGDLAFVERGHNTGTFRVLDVVQETKTDEPLQLNIGIGALQTIPRIESLDLGNNQITFDTDLELFFTNTSKVAVILDNTKILQAPTEETDFVLSAVVLDVVSYDNVTKTLEFNPNNSANLNSTSAFTRNHSDLLQVGLMVTGFNKIPISSYVSLGLSNSGRVPSEINIEGFTISSTFGGGASGDICDANNTLTVDYDANDGTLKSISFESVFDTCVKLGNPYPIVNYIDRSDGNQKSFFMYLLLGDQITIQYTIKKGIYVDNTFPRMGARPDYTGNNTHYFSTAYAYGMRNLSEFNFSHNSTGVYTEKSNVVIRRLRRFTPDFNSLSISFDSLNLLYEQRYGLVSTITKDPAPPNIVTLTASLIDREGNLSADGTATQVGIFTEVVNEGDYVNVLDNTGEEILRLKVISADTETVLKCKYISGDIPNPIDDHSFLLETKKHIVPQLQSYNKFVNTAFSEKFISSTGQVDLTDGDLYLTDPNQDFLDVVVGDYILIDNAGLLDGTVNEYGVSRRGDRGKINTLIYTSATDQGYPSALDDNRGAYKVTAIDEDNGISVEPVYSYAGYSPSDYNILPTIDGEDGGGLRETRPINNGSYTGDDYSIAPFKYKVLTKISEVDEELADTMLFFRERTLSWNEKILTYCKVKPSTWAIYESEGYIKSIGVGDPTHPTNSELVSIEGEVTHKPADVPFVTTFDSLSVLDRRFLIEDLKVFEEGYGSFYNSPEDNTGIPTLLNSSISFMEAREKRYSWINVRVNRITGTLPEADRVDFSNPSKKALEDIS